MSTVTELLALIEAQYSSAVTSAQKVIYMNEAQKRLCNDFGLVVVDESLSTIADDDEYAFPTGLTDITQIEYLEIEKDANQTGYVVASTNMKVGAYTIAAQPASESRLSVLVTTQGTADTMGTVVIVGTVDGTATTETVTPIANSRVWTTNVFSAVTSVTGVGWVIASTNDKIQVGVNTDRYNYTRYKPVYEDEDTVFGYCYRQGISSSGAKSLILYPVPTTTGYNIRIKYHKALTALSADSASASPDFDSDFHEMLAYYACYKIAGSGASPDYIQSNHFLSIYNDMELELNRKQMNRDAIYSRKPRDNRHWHN
jgi:hypothetical protein